MNIIVIIIAIILGLLTEYFIKKNNMNVRRNEIGNLFLFLITHKDNIRQTAAVCKKLENEIREEQNLESNLSRNDYLANLMILDKIRLNYMVYEHKEVFFHYDKDEFERFTNYFIDIVKLHGLGIAQ